MVRLNCKLPTTAARRVASQSNFDKILCVVAYFSDLSFYNYIPHDNPRQTKNVGWLKQGHAFNTMVASEDTQDLLWSFCTISVMQTRGIHECDLCEPPRAVAAARSGANLLLGSSEIRVFSRESGISPLPQQLRETEG